MGVERKIMEWDLSENTRKKQRTSVLMKWA